jgi:hypothetical protein
MHGSSAMQPSTSGGRADTGAFVFIALIGWFSLVFGLGVSGQLEELPRFLIPMVLFGTTLGTWLLSRRIAAVSQWLGGLDIRALVAVHVVRWPIGIWFLAADRNGELPGEFALLAGWGDIATGFLAVATLPFDEHTAWGRRVVAVFNALGLIDILVVVITAQRLLVFGDTDVRVGHPFVLLPMFVVPVVIVAHAWTFTRLVARSAAAAPPRGPHSTARA